MPDTIHAIKTPQAPEQDTFVTIANIPEDGRLLSRIPAGVKKPKNA